MTAGGKKEISKKVGAATIYFFNLINVGVIIYNRGETFATANLDRPMCSWKQVFHSGKKPKRY